MIFSDLARRLGFWVGFSGSRFMVTMGYGGYGRILGVLARSLSGICLLQRGLEWEMVSGILAGWFLGLNRDIGRFHDGSIRYPGGALRQKMSNGL